MRRREERSRFFQILLADFSQRLVSLSPPISFSLSKFLSLDEYSECVFAQCIPSKFLANLKGNLPETVELRNASERRWRVRVRNIGSATYFDEGWSEFAESESLQQCDFLTFTFDGKSCFRVLVFCPNGCEKWDTVNEDKSRAAVVSRAMETESGKRKTNSEKTERSEALVNEARERALKFVAKLGPSSPHFLAVMKPSHLDGKRKMVRFPDLSGSNLINRCIYTETDILLRLIDRWLDVDV